MGKVVGGITDAIGITDNEGERKAANAASDANAAATQLSKEQLEMAKAELQFQKDRYQDWQNIYGDIQENLGNYYKNLDPDQVATMGLQNQQREYQQVRNSIERDFVHNKFIKETAHKLNISNLNAIKADAFGFINRSYAKYNIIFADPPYDLKGIDQIPDIIFSRDLLEQGGCFILEHSANYKFDNHPFFSEHRFYGSVNFTFFKK